MALRTTKNLKNIQYTKSRIFRYFATSTRPSGNEDIATGRASIAGSTVNIPSDEIVTKLPPLSEPLPGLPEVIYATAKPDGNQTQVTKLSNGLRVASEKRFGQFCTIGVVIDSGPRYEIAYPNGVSHFLEKLAFHSTENFSSKDNILKELEKHGGICDCQGSRDTFIYAASAESRGIESIIRLLADVTLRPSLTEGEVQFAKQTVQFELESLGMRPEQEPILMDMIHAAAYRDNTLGLPKICPKENLDIINRNVLYKYLGNHHTPERMVVAGVGVNHDDLVKYVEKYFINEKPIWSGVDIPGSGATAIDKSVAQYTGGLKAEKCEIPIYTSAGLPELVHVVIGLEGCSHHDNDFIAACVLNIMMGGGGSFSAGGPGKGMYTRLYTNVLNRYHWMYSATAYNHTYSDTGLFCIHASAPPNNLKNIVEVITKELVTMANKPGDQELQRAKTQLKSMLLMNLEARPVVFEDIARQVLATGERKPPKYFIEEIDKITSQDIQRIAVRLLASPPSLAARGNIEGLPPLTDIQTALAGNGRLPGNKRLSLFR